MTIFINNHYFFFQFCNAYISNKLSITHDSGGEDAGILRRFDVKSISGINTKIFNTYLHNNKIINNKIILSNSITSIKEFATKLNDNKNWKALLGIDLSQIQNAKIETQITLNGTELILNIKVLMANYKTIERNIKINMRSVSPPILVEDDAAPGLGITSGNLHDVVNRRIKLFGASKIKIKFGMGIIKDSALHPNMSKMLKNYDGNIGVTKLKKEIMIVNENGHWKLEGTKKTDFKDKKTALSFSLSGKNFKNKDSKLTLYIFITDFNEETGEITISNQIKLDGSAGEDVGILREFEINVFSGIK